MIFLADGNATAGQDQVVAGRRGAQRGARRLARIGHDAEVIDRAAQAFEQGTQGVAVGVVDAARLERLAGHRQLVAGGKQRHAQAAEHRQLRCADRSGDADMRGRQPRPGRQYLGAGGDVLAAAADPFAGLRQMIHGQQVALDGAEFLHHHGIGAGRQRRPGENARRRARREHLADAAGGNALGHFQVRARGRDVGAAQGVAVHRGVVQRRHVERRVQRLRQHPPRRGLGRHRLGLAQRLRAGQQTGQGLVEIEHGAHQRNSR